MNAHVNTDSIRLRSIATNDFITGVSVSLRQNTAAVGADLQENPGFPGEYFFHNGIINGVYELYVNGAPVEVNSQVVTVRVFRGGIVESADTNNRWINAGDRRWGLVGDGVTDETSNIQNLIDYTESLEANLHIPAGTYLLSDTLNLPNQRFQIRGDGPNHYLQNTSNATTFVQSALDKNIFKVVGSAQNLISRVSFENMRLKGPGRDVSTGAGIELGGTEDQYAGDFVFMKNIFCEEFQNGLLVDGVAQIHAQFCSFRSHAVCLNLRSSIVNSALFLSINAGEALDTVCKITAGSGAAGITFIGGDFGNSPRMMEISGTGGAIVNIIGMNWERCTNSDIGNGEYIFMRQSAQVFINGVFFRSNTSLGGFNQPIVRAAGNAYVAVGMLRSDVDLNIVPHVAVDDNLSRVYATIPIKVNNQGSIYWVGAPEDILTDSPGGVNINNRGKIHYRKGISSSVPDRFELHYKNAQGNPDIINLIGNKPDLYSLDGSGSGHVENSLIITFKGKVNFTASGGAFTDVVVNVGPIHTPLGTAHVNGTVRPPTSAATHVFTCNLYSINVATGDVTFRVHHPSYSATQTSFSIGYIIGIVPA